MLLASLFATVLATVASPSDYEKIEYLESTGTQWIDTGLNADGGLSLEIKCRLVEGTGGSQHALGAINKIDGVNYRHHLVMEFGKDNDVHFCDYYCGSGDLGTVFVLPESAFAAHVHLVQNGCYSIDGSDPVKITGYSSDFDCKANYYLFGRNGLNHPTIQAVYCSKVRIYSAKFLRGGTLVADFIPVVDKTGKGCLYDYVTGQAFYDAGTSGVPFEVPETRLGPVGDVPVELKRVTPEVDSAHVKMSVLHAFGGSCDVRIKYGLSPDALTKDALLVSGASAFGSVEGDLLGLQPRQTYYAALYGVCGDWQGELGETFSFQTLVRLPDGYEQVAYVESTGEQYIDTGITPDRTTVVTLDWLSCKPTSSTELSVPFQVPLGTKNADSTAKQMCVLIGARNNLQGGVLCETWASPTVVWDASTRHQVVLDAVDKAIYLDGEKQTNVTPVVESLPSIYLFARHSPSAGAEYFALGRCYGCTIFKGGQLVRRYVPVYERDSGKCGLYDLVNGHFAKNDGTGADFQQTPVAVPQSDVEYREYLESDGTGYIFTGFFPSAHTRVLVDWRSDKKDGDSFQVPLGMRDAGTGYGFGFYINSKNEFTAALFSSFSSSGYPWSEGTRHLVRMDAAASEAYFDFYRASASKINRDYDYSSVYLFARNNGLGIEDARAKGRLYGCKIFEGDVLEKEFVPVRHKSGLLGLYERVGGLFYFNCSQQGAFKVGEPWAYGHRRVEYIESHGAEYVNTGVTPTSQTDVEFKWMSLKELNDPYQYLFGLREESLNKFYGFYIGTPNTCVGVLAGESKTVEGLLWNKGECKTVALNGSTKDLSIDGKVRASDIAIGTLPDVPMYLFARDNQTSAGKNEAANPAVGRLYSAKIRQGGNLVRDFIPVVRKGDNKAMLYDKVWGVYFENLGEGEFTAPPPRGLVIFFSSCHLL